MRNLVQFYAKNKFLLMSYNQKELSVLGKVVANHERKQLKDVFKKLEIHLYSAFENPARKPSNLNVIMHALGYFSKKVSLVERNFFLIHWKNIREQVPLSIPLKNHIFNRIQLVYWK